MMNKICAFVPVETEMEEEDRLRMAVAARILAEDRNPRTASAEGRKPHTTVVQLVADHEGSRSLEQEREHIGLLDGPGNKNCAPRTAVGDLADTD